MAEFDQVDSSESTEGSSRGPVDVLLRHLKASPTGLSSREAARRLVVDGPNELVRRGGRTWPREIAKQFTHPLALLLWLAAALALGAGTPVLAAAIVAVIFLNALFAFVQERQAERAVEALKQYLPRTATVRRDGSRVQVDARTLVPGDVLIIAEGDRISADARLLEGAVEVDTSTLTGESAPAYRVAGDDEDSVLMQARNIVFSGTACTGGEATALVVATGMHTELGRIAALSERVTREESPLEHQMKRVAWLIALVAVGIGFAFLPLGVFAAGLPLADALAFAIGLIVANVPEGLLPTITLALAVGVRVLARSGALVKRLSAVETLGSTTVICTDKTGTLTENRMRATTIWVPGAEFERTVDGWTTPEPTLPLRLLLKAVAACNNADLGTSDGDATELALLDAAASFGEAVTLQEREHDRRGRFHFDPSVRLMSTVDELNGDLWVHVKGAPEEVLARSCRIIEQDGRERTLSADDRAQVVARAEAHELEGLRVLGVARRAVPSGSGLPATREEAEHGLTLLGLVAMLDPPRREVAAAVATCRRAGIRVIVITGDAPLTGVAIARQVGIVGDNPRVISGTELDELTESELDHLLREEPELVFARSSPEAKLRIADALRAEGNVVAMTGDGVNDAPALRRSDIGIAMGRSGTEVAREAATIVLTDDNFATIAAAVEAGRRVYANVRKFIVYIFAHATPEAVPFLVFALSGGAVPLPLTVLQILAIDLGTETLPALALGREPAEPGLMDRPPQPRTEGVIQRAMLFRAWVVMGGVSAVLVMGGFLYVLLRAGWSPGDSVSSGTRLHAAYIEATTMTFAGIVACQVGTAFASRTERAALWTVGVFSNRLLLWGILFELLFAGAVIYLPPLQDIFGTASLGAEDLLILLPFPFVVWGTDELRRFVRRRSSEKAPTAGALRS